MIFHQPSYEEFVMLACDCNLVPVYRRHVGDTLTPVTAYCKLREGEFLFESVVCGERLERYSFLGAGVVANSTPIIWRPRT